MTDIVVSEEAKRQARAIGIGGDVEKRLYRMAERAAPLTHPAGNRRYMEFVLLVKNHEVLAVSRL